MELGGKAELLELRPVNNFKSYVERNKMMKIKIATGVAHKVPADLREALTIAPKVLAVWNDLTPLARNEWICWIISVKKPETRKHHIERACAELIEGKRRPCCWSGCSHR